MKLLGLAQNRVVEFIYLLFYLISSLLRLTATPAHRRLVHIL